jgi:hypothetical protein
MKTLHDDNRSKGEPLLPLVRLRLILPFVQELERIEVDADAVLMRNGLVREIACHDPGRVPFRISR